jgi:cyclic beta-1,2-glucan synthetase
MGWNEDKLRDHAHKLALEHDPHERRLSPKTLWRQLEGDIGELRTFVRELHENQGACGQPAEEWLLDHSEFIEAEILGLKEDTLGLPAKTLPAVGKAGERRISAICAAYLEETDGFYGEETLVAYLEAYQEVSVLSIAEAWSLPVFMKIELIRRLAALMEPVKERRNICARVDRMLADIPPSELTPERLKESLEGAGLELPLSGAVIVQLVRHLREHAEDSAHLGEWLVCKLDNGPESLDSILSYDYQLQAQYQVSTGNVIGSLRNLSRTQWSPLFEQISMVENTLRQERAEDYPRLDSASRHTLRSRTATLAKRMRVPENLVAAKAVELADGRFHARKHEAATSQAAGADAKTGSSLLSRDCCAAYYLLEGRGLKALQKALRLCGKTGALPEAGIKTRAAMLYMQLLVLAFATVLILVSLWIGRSAGNLSLGGWIAVVLLAALPASEYAITALHWLIERVKTPSRLLRYDFSEGVPEDAATMVVIPVIWSTPEDAAATAERMELHYLANRDPNIHFAILSDFRDADKERLPQDEKVLKQAVSEIEKLNSRYPEATFHLFHRSRQWNDAEQIWMGWERKRGKLVEFVRLLKGDEHNSFGTVAGDSSVLSRIRYVITLDADTRLPLESGRRMIGAMHLPYNRPRLNAAGTRVVEGHGVLQPRIGMTYESARKSRLASIWSSEPGLDPYAFAVSDPYQDAMGQGIFTGKGIFDVDAFYTVLGQLFPENSVLSHDLLEGGFLRAGFLSDIELIDDCPSTFLSHQKRQHRWTRGDWQLLPWLKRHTRNADGERIAADLTPLTRWQIVDNLRRSLLSPVLLAIAILAVPVLPGSPWRWYGLVLLTLCAPFVRQLLTPHTLVYRPKGLLLTLVQCALAFITLPFQCIMLLDAVGRTLYRITVSKRRLLEWVSQSEVERQSGNKGQPVLSGLTGGYMAIVLLAFGLFAGRTIPAGGGWGSGGFGGQGRRWAFFPADGFWGSIDALQLAGLAGAVLWALAPLVVRWLDREAESDQVMFSKDEEQELRKLSADIWAFYEAYVTEEDSWLPPDNVQMEGDKGVAHRTSPTNIGLYLTCVLAARDFGFIDTPGMIERLERTIGTIERMEKWEGHLYNWYDTTSLAPLNPVYVSTVDSGNLAVCLIAAREGLLEWMETDGHLGMNDLVPDRRRSRSKEEFQVAFAQELTPHIGRRSTVRNRGTRLAARMEALARSTNFRPLLDGKTNLFSLGYHVKEGKRDNVLYDLLASEARQASFVAIAMGQVPVSHWNVLGRTLTKSGSRPLLLSWSGTMFEYLMPWLFMKTYRDTLWDSTYQAVVDRQIEYARQRKVPFGISESGYYAFDYQMNYQYRAFGVPGLGFKRGLEQDLVLAPYATVMSLPFSRDRGIAALHEMEEWGARGKYGFYEAIDCTPRRMPGGSRHMVIRSFMAHHQGMSLLTLGNLLLPRTMYDRFHKSKEIQAAELLLQERIPSRPKWIRHPEMYRSTPRQEKQPADTASVREFRSPHTTVPEVCLLSNGRFMTMVTASGAGYSSWDGLSVTRWREEPVRDSWVSGIYIWDVGEDKLWSASYQPARVKPDEELIRFELDKAVFRRRDGQVETKMEIAVSPETDAEVRRITLVNHSDEKKVLEVTTFMELAMSSPIADDAHPAFSKLFVRTAYDEETGCLVAGRRPRTVKDRSLWSAHLLASDGQSLGPVEFETDRAAFVGRGYTLAEPQSAKSRLKAKTGSVADPAFIMRRRVELGPGEKAVLYAVTAVADERQDAVEAAARLACDQQADRAFRLAWNRSRIEVRSLQLDGREAAMFQRLAGLALYTPPLRKDRREAIAANVKGQWGLWSFGISGDRPIMVVQIGDKSHLPFVIKLLTGHEYARRLGLIYDLVILNLSRDGYQQDLQEALQRAAEHGVDRFGHGVSGIHVIPVHRLEEEEKLLLLAAARVNLQAGGASLASQLRALRGDSPALALVKTGDSTEGTAGADSRMPAALESGAKAGETGMSPAVSGGSRVSGMDGTGGAWTGREGAGGKQPNLDGTGGARTPVHTAYGLSRTAESSGVPSAGMSGAPGQGFTPGAEHAAGRGTLPPAAAADPKELLFYNGWGGFTPDGREYRLTIADGRHLPGPWTNVLANPSFGALVTELGTGYTFWRNSRECKLTPWSNDPVLDPPGEQGYVKDEESGLLWTLTPSPGKYLEPYTVVHGQGYSMFRHEREGIRHELTLFVPVKDPVKIMRLRLSNISSRQRRLSLAYYAEWVLGVGRQQTAAHIVVRRDEAASIMTAQNTYQEHFREATAFLGIFPEGGERREGMGLGGGAGGGDESRDGSGGQSWTSDQLEFIGRNGSMEAPSGMAGNRLSNRTGVQAASCGAIRQELILLPGEEREILILLGCTSSEAEAAALARQYADVTNCDAAWAEMEQYWNTMLHQVKVTTPAREMDLLLNGWLLYQTLACRIWARSGFFQAGGAFGYRDQLQDTLALLHTAPEFARRQVLLHAAHQYEEGDVQHWWHEETERGIRTLFSDDLLWLPYVASRYTEHTGDSTLWEENAPYLVSEPLKEGEHERYEPTVLSGRTGTIYEHCLQAIEKALSRIGEHGLPLIGVGDWNDGLNLAGDKGRGESVWLAWFLGEILQRFEGICGERGETERAARYRERRESLFQAANAHAWDGQWYRRAFTDSGTWLGSIRNDECRIDAIAQSWSVLSGGAPDDRAWQAMRSFDRELVDRELALARLLTPAFDKTDPSPGYIQGYPPGIRENGAQYTHGVIWSIAAWSKLGQADKAVELFHLLNPVNHTRTDQEVRQYTGEPYVMAADVYTSEPHRGHAGWTWYTGAAGWMYQVGLEWILGIRRRGDRLCLDPCVPDGWPGFQVDYRFGSTVYTLVFSREQSAVGGRDVVLQSGPDAFLDLVDDHMPHRITVILPLKRQDLS